MNTTPIEFIAFKIDENKMYSHYEIDDMDKEGFAFWSDVTKGANGWMPMQLTSLRSINDKPIYNRMIVKDKCGDLFEIDMFNYDRMAQYEMMELEILGNKFQNPELLELCK